MLAGNVEACGEVPELKNKRTVMNESLIENIQTSDAGQQAFSQCNVMRRFFEEMSVKHNVDINSLNVHITNGSIYVSKYSPGYIEMFKLLEIID